MRPTGEAAAHPVCVCVPVGLEAAKAERRGWLRGRALPGESFLAGIKAAFPPMWPHSTAITRAHGLPGPTVSFYIAFENIGKNHKNNKHVISKIGKEHKVESTGGNKS